MLLSDVFSIKNKELDSLVLWRIADNISAELESETIILNQASGYYNGLNEVGTTIWKLLEHPINFQAICRRIVDEYDVEEDVCRTDLLAFLHQLAENNLISIKNDSSI